MIKSHAPDQLQLTALRDFPLVFAGDNLAELIVHSLRANNLKCLEHDVLAVAQKVVSKAEDRSVLLSEVEPSEEARRRAKETGKDPRIVELILRESTEVVRQTDNLIITENHLGLVMANAGIDQSNVDEGCALLLPQDPDKSAITRPRWFSVMIVHSLRANNLKCLEHDVLAVAQKVVSKAEDRSVLLSEVEPSEEARRRAKETGKDPRIVELILRESTEVVRQTDNLIITENHLGLVMANAGIDQSNVDEGCALLLPQDPDKSAMAFLPLVEIPSQICDACQRQVYRF